MRHHALARSLTAALELSDRAARGAIDGEIDRRVRPVTFPGHDEESIAASHRRLAMTLSTDATKLHENATRIPAVLFLEAHRDAADAIAMAIERKG